MLSPRSAGVESLSADKQIRLPVHVPVLDALEKAAGHLQHELGNFDPALLSGPQCAAVVKTLATTEKACAAARALTAAWAVALGRHRAQGFADGPEWLARQMGSASGEARLALGTAASIGSCPEAKQALVAGELSLAQAHEIARSQPELPGTEHELVDLARRFGLTAVRDAHVGEVCQVQSGAPLPVERLHPLSEDAFIKVVLHDGVRISTVKHFGRHIPAELRTALELGPPPGFEGTACAEEGCGRRYGLEWDHVDPVAHHGPTSYDNLQPRCWPHHRDKTERDRQAGLLGRWST